MMVNRICLKNGDSLRIMYSRMIPGTIPKRMHDINLLFNFWLINLFLNRIFPEILPSGQMQNIPVVPAEQVELIYARPANLR